MTERATGVRYLGIEVDDALSISEQIELRDGPVAALPCPTGRQPVEGSSGSTRVKDCDYANDSVIAE
jgi:hypothetical protein